MQLLGIGCGVGVVISSIVAFVGSSFPPSPKDAVASVYQLFFGLMIIANEFKLKTLMKWFRFLVPYVGVGAFYIFLAFFCISEGKWYQYLVAAVVGFLGGVYCLLGCTGNKRDIEMPANEDGIERQELVQYSGEAAAYAAQHVKPSDIAAASAAASAHLEEGRNAQGAQGGAYAGSSPRGAGAGASSATAEANPFEHDNPFESRGYGRTAYN